MIFSGQQKLSNVAQSITFWLIETLRPAVLFWNCLYS